MPSSRRTSQPSSSSLNGPRPESHRVRIQSPRPEKYSVAHLPRHVSPAVAEDDDVDVEAHSDRQAKIKRRLRLKRRLTPWELAGFAASCVACAFLVREISSAQADFRQIHGQVVEKQAQFRALDKQRNDEKSRLAHLKSEKGREQLLAERGYLKPGDRILLFPAEEKTPAEAQD